MSNKFLGLNSINVLKAYIDEAIVTNENNTRGLKTVTVQAYTYVKNDMNIPNISGGSFDPVGSVITYPTGWDSLKNVIDNLKDEEGNVITLDDALANGVIYMSVGTIGKDNSTNNSWSRPMIVSGQNGADGADGAAFKFSYTIDGEYSEDVLQLLDEDGKREIYYQYKAVGAEEWSSPMIWAKYTTDGRNGNDGCQALYRYCATGKDEEGNMIVPVAPASSTDENWNNTILNVSISEETPYLWMSTANVIAGKTLEESEANGVYAGWSDPILFSKLGLDGNVPDYNITLYTMGAEEDGLIKPDAPVFGEIDEETGEYKEFFTLDVVKENNPTWVEVPTDDAQYWWMCTFKVRGLDNKVLEIGSLKRYNGVDGEAQPGEWSEMCYRWSENQTMPELHLIEGASYPEDWSPQYPVPQPVGPETTLWMTIGKFKGMNEDGTPHLVGDWSEPVRLTGPAGPLSYDYRLELRYAEGTASTPYANATWQADPGEVYLNNTYMYMWVKPYLVYYKMKYTDEPKADGTYDIVQVNTVPDGVIKEFTPYRASGLNGDNGNTKNKLMYNFAETNIEINSFANENLYIYNGADGITYNLNYNQIDFETGYTGKFSNVGSGNMTITTVEPYAFIGSGKIAADKIVNIVVAPHETIELVCYKMDTEKSFIVIGKEI